MALTQKSRTAIYEVLAPGAGEEAVEEMLSYFPARDTDEPATRGDLLLTKAELRTDMGALRADMAEFKTDLRDDMAEFKTAVRGDLAALGSDIAGLRIGQADLRTEMHQSMATMARWIAGGNVAAIGLAVVIGRALG